MTAKERREYRRMEVRCEEYAARAAKDMDVYRDNLSEIVTLRIALRNAHDALVDAVIAINEVVRGSDRLDKRIEVWSEK